MLNKKRQSTEYSLNLKQAFDHEKEPKANQPTAPKFKFVIFLIFFSMYLMISTFVTLRIDDSYRVSSAVRNIFENVPFSSADDVFQDISTRSQALDYFFNVMLPQIFNEEVKDYSALVDGYHYINNFNYFMGMRVTVNLAKLNSKKVHGNTIKPARRDNYEGRTDQTFDHLYTETINNTNKYSDKGGYVDKGGYIYYLHDNMTFNEANDLFNGIKALRTFNESFLTNTIEVILYNENLQTGIVLAYELLENNAGAMEKHIRTDAFYASRYSSHYHQLSSFEQGFLVFLDFVWLI